MASGSPRLGVMQVVDFQTDPSRYRHGVSSATATLPSIMDVDPRAACCIAMSQANSYDLLSTFTQRRSSTSMLRYPKCIALSLSPARTCVLRCATSMSARQCTVTKLLRQVHQRDAAGDRGCQREFHQIHTRAVNCSRAGGGDDALATVTFAYEDFDWDDELAGDD